jgi:hypothetical protein
MPAADARDESLEQLDAVAKYSADCGEFADGVRAAGAAILACRNKAWDAADELATRIGYMRVGLDDAAEAAAKLAQGGLEGAEQARQNVFRSRRRELVSGINKEFADDGVKLGMRAQTAMKELKSKIDIARAKWTFSEFDLKEDVAQLISIDRLGEQMRARGIEATYDTYAALLQAGADAEAQKVERGCERWIRNLLSESPKDKVAKATHGLTKEVRSGDIIATERRLCEAMLREFETQRAKRVPPELTLAAMIYTDLLIPAFRRIVGKQIWDLPSMEFNAITAGTGKIPDPLEMLEGWWSRNIPEARDDSRTVSQLVMLRRGGDAGPPGWTMLERGRRMPVNPVANQVSNDRSVARAR